MKDNVMSKDKPLNKNIKKTESTARQGPKPPKKITDKYLYNSGLAYLQRFPSSISNFRAVMDRKIKKSLKHHGAPTMDECLKMLDDTIQKFTKMGLLDDSAFLKGMMTSYKKRGISKNMIFQKLQQKGLCLSDIQTALKDYEDYHKTSHDQELVSCVRLIRKKRLGPFRIKENFEHQKELATIARAGYSFEIAQKTLKLSLENAEEILSEIPY